LEWLNLYYPLILGVAPSKYPRCLLGRAQLEAHASLIKKAEKIGKNTPFGLNDLSPKFAKTEVI
jgi:hypothetical protein